MADEVKGIERLNPSDWTDGSGGSYLRISPKGQYVHYEDYAALEAKLRQTERALELACEEIEAYDNARVVLTEDFIAEARAELQEEGKLRKAEDWREVMSIMSGRGNLPLNAAHKAFALGLKIGDSAQAQDSEGFTEVIVLAIGDIAVFVRDILHREWLVYQPFELERIGGTRWPMK